MRASGVPGYFHSPLTGLSMARKTAFTLIDFGNASPGNGRHLIVPFTRQERLNWNCIERGKKES